MSAERIAELKAKIAAIDAALLKLATGERTVKLSYEGNSVEYQAGDKDLLKELRQQAMAELGTLTGRRRGPYRMVTG
ncbi:MAG: gpW family head-tail joining protein [Hyphomonas sp.]|nr:gpW family head-tail joining protein [Hyphomonas sp.]